MCCARVLASDNRFERIDHIAPEVGKAVGIARGVVRQDDRRDQCVHLLDSAPHALTLGDNMSVLRCSSGVE